jgi:hypothetical protein
MWKKTHTPTNYSQVSSTFHKRHYVSKEHEVDGDMEV